MSRRRYKKDVYAIPYEGEEVKLHWANSDQYYIKTAEYFNHYRFKLDDGKTVEFCLRDADVEQNNNTGENRFFVLCQDEDPETLKNTLFIYFEYVPREKKGKSRQEEINRETYNLLKQKLEKQVPELFRQVDRLNKERWTILEKHLNRWTKKNNLDYFIHKDLGNFLKRELDFFIKNEVLYLDDIIDSSPQDLGARLIKLKAIKEIAHKIIAFLSQLEEFQKKLWLKKKFVVETNYCLTLDRVPEVLYPEIIQNTKQQAAWIKLFAIDELAGYSKGLKGAFLKAHPSLVLDTAHFDTDFKYRLLASVENLDEQTDGLLIHSENFQALNLLQEKFAERVKCIYIDPPYNSSSSEIIYKNNYKHSSWLSLMENRILSSKALQTKNGVFALAIDDTELSSVLKLLENMFINYYRAVVVVNHHPAGAGLQGANISKTHEYVIFLTPTSKNALHGSEKEGDFSSIGFMRTGAALSNKRLGSPNSFYAVLVDQQRNKVVGLEPPPKGKDYPRNNTKEGLKRIYPVSPDGTERVWRRSYESGLKEIELDNISYSQGKKTGSLLLMSSNKGKRDPIFSNWTAKKYNAGVYGTGVLKNILGDNIFSYPKSIYTVEDCVRVVTNIGKDACVLDYFAGSGTTGHAVININREDGGKRKYILVEVGDYFDTVLMPRIQKVIYSEDWKDGKPVDREGSSHCFKYIRLESYEDALNNLERSKFLTEDQQSLLADEALGEQYLLNYMLELETRDSLLNIKMFEKPFNYELKIIRDQETRCRKVDLVETFNYLLGLHVKRIRLVEDVLMIFGKTRKGERVLALWRDIDKTDNDSLDHWFAKNKPDFEYDQLYVNSDNNLEGAHLIESVFHKKMFA